MRRLVEVGPQAKVLGGRPVGVESQALAVSLEVVEQPQVALEPLAMLLAARAKVLCQAEGLKERQEVEAHQELEEIQEVVETQGEVVTQSQATKEQGQYCSLQVLPPS